ncbi:7982_t:CDS:2 [Dentiscutata erythropus]|uniref:7982_t:CDS:1 n=1 Tax=Dentiscutata erythropus TaxID=1348616 RepID=A0A9N8W018_9GLOM|nr:7982_t:CDS:2 [Dentiscutata erythropus]
MPKTVNVKEGTLRFITKQETNAQVTQYDKDILQVSDNEYNFMPDNGAMLHPWKIWKNSLQKSTRITTHQTKPEIKTSLMTNSSRLSKLKMRRQNFLISVMAGKMYTKPSTRYRGRGFHQNTGNRKNYQCSESSMWSQDQQLWRKNTNFLQNNSPSQPHQ